MSGGEPADIREQNDLLLMAYGSMSPVARRLSMPYEPLRQQVAFARALSRAPSVCTAPAISP